MVETKHFESTVIYTFGTRYHFSGGIVVESIEGEIWCASHSAKRIRVCELPFKAVLLHCVAAAHVSLLRLKVVRDPDMSNMGPQAKDMSRCQQRGFPVQSEKYHEV